MEEKVNTFNFSKIIIFVMFISVGPDIIGDIWSELDAASVTLISMLQALE